MNELRGRVFALLRQADGGCFLRNAREDDVLWVTDLPRRAGEPQETREQLERMRVNCRLDAQRRLWYLDPTLAGYAELLERLPSAPPPFPAEEELHQAYALCRLLLAHPSPLEGQPLWALRRVLKLASGERGPMIDAIPRMHEQCAALLRQRSPLPAAAGRVLAHWLYKEDNKNDHSL